MGSKRVLAPAIATMIDSQHPRAAVLDAFSGMCAIGTQLAPTHRVIANDAHAFAEAVARALFTAPARRPSRRTATAELMPWFNRNSRLLTDSLQRRLAREREALTRAEEGGYWRQLMQFTLDELEAPVPRAIRGLPTPASYRRRRGRAPYALFSMYYASAYFGIRQAMEIDSLRYAIDRAPDGHSDFYLYALIQACSHCAAAPGHFAQHLVPRDKANTLYIARMRRRSVLARFWAALKSISVPRCLDRAGNRVYREDATDFVRGLAVEAPADVDLVIYADPPYSKAQYSRYYHVLETLVLYDYPDATGKGRYRDGRFQTDFSRVAQVDAAMDDFVGAAATTGASLYLSYPRNGLLFKHGADLRELMRAHYPFVRLAMTQPLSHSTMGGAPGAGAVNVTEDVYYGGWE
jgi:adenine-specific DNA-methyltransferase